jgi:hypothetical protein
MDDSQEAVLPDIRAWLVVELVVRWELRVVSPPIWPDDDRPMTLSSGNGRAEMIKKIIFGQWP